jgi:hypothetical protein
MTKVKRGQEIYSNDNEENGLKLVENIKAIHKRNWKDSK